MNDAENGEIDVGALRRDLREELGEERFFAFVRDSHAACFKWWQEKAWARFVEHLPQYACEMDALRVFLRWCPLHDTDLRRDTAALFHGNMTFTPDCHRQAAHAYPYANTGPVPTQGAPTDATVVDVWFCADCRVAKAAWHEEHRGWVIPKTWLQRPVSARTLEDLMRDSMHSMELSGEEVEALMASVRNKAAQGRKNPGEGKITEFLTEVRENDEIWRFKSPPETWASLSGRAGYGLVRDGRCIRIVVTMLN